MARDQDKKFSRRNILDGKTVYVRLPKKKIRKLFHGHDFLSARQAREMRRCRDQIETALLKLNHAKSVVDKILLRQMQNYDSV